MSLKPRCILFYCIYYFILFPDGNPILCFQLASGCVSEEIQSTRSKVSLSVILPNAYPSVAPRISISSNDLKREAQNSLTSSVTEFSKTLPAEPMVMDIVCWVQEHLQEYIQGNDLNDQHTTRFNQAGEKCTMYSTSNKLYFVTEAVYSSILEG